MAIINPILHTNGIYKKFIDGSIEGKVVLNDITKIGDYGIYNKGNITELELPNVTEIGRNAIHQCTHLIKLTLPKCVKVGSYGIYNNSGATTSSEITTILSDDLRELGNSALAASKFTHAPLKRIQPLKVIPNDCFYSCSKLIEVEMPSGLTEIGSSAFKYCNALSLLDFRGRTLDTVPTLKGALPTYSVDQLKIVVPDALYDAWTIAPNWVYNASNIVKESEYSD